MYSGTAGAAAGAADSVVAFAIFHRFGSRDWEAGGCGWELSGYCLKLGPEL